MDTLFVFQIFASKGIPSFLSTFSTCKFKESPLTQPPSERKAVRLPAEAGLFCSLCSIWGWTCSRKPILQLSGLRSQKAKGLKWKILHRWTH
ncbi:Activating Transcription Factor 7-Interacting Protein 1 [Manis pentadactyla]|nr:Activating Transcription Factor 7-Interacting Protein 1 [Manis pentadactyla]